jgi:hypothetical protein
VKPPLSDGIRTSSTLWSDWHKEDVDLIVIYPSISAKWILDWSGKELKLCSRVKFVTHYTQGEVLKGQYSLDKILVDLVNIQGKGKISTLEGKLKRYTKLANSTRHPINY